MLSIEECKKYIGSLNLNDKEIEDIRDHLTAFVETALDFVLDSNHDVLRNRYEKQNENIKE